MNFKWYLFYVLLLFVTYTLCLNRDWEDQRELLMESLKGRDDFGSINTDEYFRCRKNRRWTWFGSDCPFFRQGFDAPFKFWNRKNEVFLVKNDWSIDVPFLLFLPNPHLTNNWYCIPIQETREWSKLKVYYKLYSLCWSINKRLIVPTVSQKILNQILQMQCHFCQA